MYEKSISVGYSLWTDDEDDYDDDDDAARRIVIAITDGNDFMRIILTAEVARKVALQIHSYVEHITGEK